VVQGHVAKFWLGQYTRSFWQPCREEDLWPEKKVGQIGFAISGQVAKRKIEKKKMKAEHTPPEEEVVQDKQLIPQEEVIE
jgi:hypothetical protein